MCPVRILFPFAGDTGLGGSHVSALNLITGLDPDRFDVRILLHQRLGTVGEYFRDMGLNCEVIEDLPLMRTLNYPRDGDVGIGRYIGSLSRRMMGEIRRLDPQIVHTNEGRIHTNWVIPTRMARRKHLWHHRQDPRAFGINKMAPLLTNQIVSVSHFSRPAAPVRPVDDIFTVVRSPFDFDDQVPDPAQARRDILAELGLPDDTLLLGWFGTLVDRKKPVRFVEAVAAIRNAVTDRPVHGLLFGGAVDTDPTQWQQCLDKAASLGMSDAISMMGFRHPIQGYMAGVDLYLVTAINEPFGRTLIESMHLGTPVIATAHGGNPEAIRDGENGFLVAPENPAAFVAPVLDLLNDPGQYARIVANARADVHAKYGREVHIRQMTEIYDRLAPPGRAA
ncbi:Glycosyltransferase involved in cell wall bisynthesis [Paracoccus isoporae]|uniref:Glycosyltransferase involved in cell wall bisynthesis n=1 Tax=Paracoccus isoporae TaxID=591205 RepID=A0A1G6UBB5_9RHOB|nr:glycosyltransferase family 4 protein [Paracoccus isoporae]SDD37986.1 Glycosyltransferase involved in cell wall bisynthesis [Paracoccus isoporae]